MKNSPLFDNLSSIFDISLQLTWENVSDFAEVETENWPSFKKYVPTWLSDNFFINLTNVRGQVRGLGTTKNNVLSQRLEQTLFDGLLFHSIIEEFQKQTDVYFVFELAGALALVSLQ